MIKSMTAFARISGQGKWGTATWDIRSLNHRYLDIGFRLPEELRHLEYDLRELLRRKISRGKIDCCLKFYPGEAARLGISLNTNLVKQLANASEEVAKIFNSSVSKIDPIRILGWNDVLHVSEYETKQTAQKIGKLFGLAVDELIATREKEGKSLRKLIEQKLQDVIIEIDKVKKQLPKIVKTYREKVMQQLAKLKLEYDNNRLEQEMVYFMQRIDVAEELDRLLVHAKEIKRVLQKTGAIGKRLDFLMQELNREANTLASKSTDKTTTYCAVTLKVLIEQMREQVQNIE